MHTSVKMDITLLHLNLIPSLWHLFNFQYLVELSVKLLTSLASSGTTLNCEPSMQCLYHWGESSIYIILVGRHREDRFYHIVIVILLVIKCPRHLIRHMQVLARQTPDYELWLNTQVRQTLLRIPQQQWVGELSEKNKWPYRMSQRGRNKLQCSGWYIGIWHCGTYWLGCHWKWKYSRSAEWGGYCALTMNAPVRVCVGLVWGIC